VSAGPPAGWYADPYGQAQQRYWDGAAWTGHTSDVPPATQTAPPAPDPGRSAPAGPAGSLGARVKSNRVLIAFIGIFAVVVIGGALAVTATEPEGAESECPPGRVCGTPPDARPPLVNRTVFESADLGFRFEYDEELWQVLEDDGRSVTLKLGGPDIDATLVVGAVPATDGDPKAVLDGQIEGLSDTVLSLEPDDSPAHAVPGASVGYRDGVGGAFSGVSDTPQGPGQPVGLVIMSAADEEVTAYASLITSEQEEDLRKAIGGAVDSLLNTFRFPTDVEASS